MEHGEEIDVNTLPIKNSTGAETDDLQVGTGLLPANLYLFDERNRAFLEYRSTNVYPYRNPLDTHQFRTAIRWLAVGVAVLLLSLLLNGAKQSLAINSTSLLGLMLGAMLGLSLIVVIISAVALFTYGTTTPMTGNDHEALVRDGKVILVPIEKCMLIKYQRSRPPIMRLKCTFSSPKSHRTMTRSFDARWPEDGSCLAAGTPIAVLFLNYRNYQVL